MNTPQAAAEVPAIREQLDRMGIDVPLVGDFHYNGHKLLTDFPGCAEALSKYRINPGNVGTSARRDDNFRRMIEVACRFGKPVRIGVNWGSLDQSLLARLMDENSRAAESLVGAGSDARGTGHVGRRERRSKPKRSACPAMRSSCRPRSPMCRTWSRSIGSWRVAATIRCTSG